MEIEGIIENIIFSNDENGYKVMKLETTDGDITAVGILPNVVVGDSLKIEGDFIFHDKYGEQIKIESFEIITGTSIISIEKYLSSRVLPHIGKKMAKRIVSKFGTDTLDILKHNPARLMEVEGIGKKKYEDIYEALEEELKTQDILIFLQGLGISIGQSQKIIKEYGEETIAKVESNPYQLINDIWGIGFKTADEIAFKNNIDKNSPFRIKAAFNYFLQNEANQNGNCYMPYEESLNKVSNLLNLEASMVEDLVTEMVIENIIIVDEINNEKIIYEPYYYNSELKVAGMFSKILVNDKIETNIDCEKEIEKLKNNEKFVFAEEQIKAIESAINENILVITGGPGTGKTTIVKNIVDIYLLNGLKVILTAPTGRAAKRLEQSCNYPAKTIHRLLGYMPVDSGRGMIFDHNEDNPLDTDILIIDESSMIDLILLENLLKGIGEGTKIIFVGDIDQLPSVGAGNILKDIIKSKLVTTIKLNKIFRQGENSNIVVNAHKINKGEFPILNEKDKDFFFINGNNNILTQKTLINLVAKRLPEYYGFKNLEDIQVLTPMKKGEIGTVELNTKLQEVLNPKTPLVEEIKYGDKLFRENDKVMQIKNNYNKEFKSQNGQDGLGVFNGDFGIIKKIDNYDNKVEVLFDNERIVGYTVKELEELSLSYAITIHKSQGSEFPVVVIPLGAGPYMLMTRNLIYTAITRAKNLVVLVGEVKYLKNMINNTHIAKRNSTLASRIREYYNLYKGVIDGD
ncbi:ATP-dependent RecD-like DNA helicase [Miniphocaeibacter massiliensis]|uniref:SF1B family DNA helicase RecD2 n=1 Tax=Miniphocaeibacter massiliensis TaxID=2041841 RepID=UPI001F5D4AF6|nr:ATP-dependent RecD-like DNA helicase [Miniphocaeibacter massiliensis]